MSDVWYHGSPLRLDTLASGSTVTRDRRVAEVFSHKPRLVSFEDDGRIRHDGREMGYLYQIAEPVGPADVEPHPRSTMPAGIEWLTRRPLRLACLGSTRFSPGELLSDEETSALRGRGSRGQDAGQ